MDITEFITWFIDQVIIIFTKVFSTLDSITFAGTSLLKVSVTIMILIPLIGVVLTISNNVSVIGSRSEKIKEKIGRNKKDEKKEN